MVYVFLADGFEEIEALAPVDFMKRAGIEVKTVGVFGSECTGTHNIKVMSDITLDEVVLDDTLQGIVLPGGMPGAENLNNCEEVQAAIDFCTANNKLIGAICAAPFILGRKGLLNGKKATCFPGFEGELTGAAVTDDGVVICDNIITAKGAGVAWEFGAAITQVLLDKPTAEKILRGIQWAK